MMLVLGQIVWNCINEQHRWCRIDFLTNHMAYRHIASVCHCEITWNYNIWFDQMKVGVSLMFATASVSPFLGWNMKDHQGTCFFAVPWILGFHRHLSYNIDIFTHEKLGAAPSQQLVAGLRLIGIPHRTCRGYLVVPVTSVTARRPHRMYVILDGGYKYGCFQK